MKIEEKISVNYRLSKGIREILKSVSRTTGITETMILEDALRFLFEKEDAATAHRRKSIQKAVKTPIIASCGDFPWTSELAMSEETCTA